MLKRAEDAVAGVTETRHDVVVRIEALILGGRVHRHVRMMLLEIFNPLGRGDEIQED